ncbi:MAG: capsular polysaccharide biosynthesis protein [Desulfuromonadales bacterium]|nr:capsular polysaccharide biosynthesis protein [Desulfuromonadales bacterium]MBN2791545.1 capsular polysaccharide biosynthesis protein [Desulfuromonadales bacterium]
MSNLLVLSRGIRKIAHGSEFISEFSSWVYNRSGDIDAVAGWGHKPTADKARRIAKQKNLPYIALEDGFLRSVRLGRDGEQPLSLVVDPVGIYYDARQPSQLEQWLEAGTWADPQLIERAREVRQWLVTERLSKYNHAPEKQLCPDDGKSRVLVIDQTFDDMSVTGALSDEQSFQKMLQTALDENPQADIIVKTHPDVLAGYRKGYLPTIPDDPRIRLLTDSVSPWSVLDGVSKVYTVSSLLGFEALLAGKSVRCFGMPFYAGWGLTEDELSCSRRNRQCTLDEVFAAAYLKYARYVDPIRGKRCEIEDIIPLLADRRRHFLQVRGRTFCSGVSPWKRKFLPDFLAQGKSQIGFVKSPQRAIDKAEARQGRWVLWASAERDDLRERAEERLVPMLRVEDAFLRSVGLGSDLVRPGSLVLDDEGIYYDCSRPSRLETLLRETDFSKQLLERAKKLRLEILKQGLTKYNVGEKVVLELPQQRTIVLVPGQVEDDASILRGSPQVRTNLNLLQKAREARPDAFIIFKPHPDVLVGNRRGAVAEEDALNWCDQVVTDAGMHQLLAEIDEVHTMTSLTGFEALLRGTRVSCYGLPFYAGWGLTEDLLATPRRGRHLNLDQLVAGSLILYPTYVDPATRQVCTVEHFLDWLIKNKNNVQGAPWKTQLIRLFQHWRQGERKMWPARKGDSLDADER